jgi:hypothetical protein
MSVIARFTDPGESILLETRPHAASLGRQLLRAVAAVVVFGGGVWLTAHAGGLWRLLGLPLAVMAAIAVLGALRAVWRWDRTILAVTSEQIVLVRGGSRRSAVSLPLDDVRRLGVDQSVPGRMLGYGTIILADGHSRQGFAYVPRPAEVGRLILRARR